MAEICQNNRWIGMPAEWVLSIVVLIFKEKGNIRNCGCNRPVELLEHGMKVMERLLEKRFHRILTVDEMQYAFMSERGTIDDVFILRRMQEEYHTKSYICDS